MLTLIYTYYGQKERIPGILAEKHPDCRVIIVDDCSPEPLQSLEGVDVYRIDTDIPWNQPGARNLGFQESEGWIVCADIDHLVTKRNIDDLLKLKKEKGTIYYLGREDTIGWNLYLIHKDDFEKIGGYDEDFCGHYGYDDTLFNIMAQKNLKVKEIRHIKAKVFAKESSSKLERDFSFNQELLKMSHHLTNNSHPRIGFQWHKI
jgi:hypothetical protein